MPSIVFAEIPEKPSALQMFFGLFSIASDRKSGSAAEKGDAETQTAFPLWRTKNQTAARRLIALLFPKINGKMRVG